MTCSTSGMGLRLKWISIEMCFVMVSWTTISFLMGYQFDKLEVSESVTIPYFLLFLDLF